MDGISRSHGWDKEILHGALPMEQLVLSYKWVRIMCLAQGYKAVMQMRLEPATPRSLIQIKLDNNILGIITQRFN